MAHRPPNPAIHALASSRVPNLRVSPSLCPSSSRVEPERPSHAPQSSTPSLIAADLALDAARDPTLDAARRWRTTTARLGPFDFPLDSIRPLHPLDAPKICAIGSRRLRMREYVLPCLACGRPLTPAFLGADADDDVGLDLGPRRGSAVVRCRDRTLRPRRRGMEPALATRKHEVPRAIAGDAVLVPVLLRGNYTAARSGMRRWRARYGGRTARRAGQDWERAKSAKSERVSTGSLAADLDLDDDDGAGAYRGAEALLDGGEEGGDIIFLQASTSAGVLVLDLGQGKGEASAVLDALLDVMGRVAHPLQRAVALPDGPKLLASKIPASLGLKIGPTASQ
ncbi:hypothetical protein DFH09DRAFT_1375751 [Mycena vulgaris]|nr:hypothetical protein DFH09DRAFT_1375751 [Mycena vulgaris]